MFSIDIDDIVLMIAQGGSMEEWCGRISGSLELAGDGWTDGGIVQSG